MPGPLVPILVSGATAAIGYFFQENAARNTRRRQQADAELERQQYLRDSELSRAKQIFEEISGALDVFYYYLASGAMYVAVRKAQGDTSRVAQDEKTWDGYEDAVLAWMTHRNRFAAHMKRYFGAENHRRLMRIEEAFIDAGSLVTSTYYERTHSVVKDGKEDSGAFYAVVRPLESELLELNDRMIRDIQDQNVGRLRQDRVSDGSAD